MWPVKKQKEKVAVGVVTDFGYRSDGFQRTDIDGRSFLTLWDVRKWPCPIVGTKVHYRYTNGPTITCHSPESRTKMGFARILEILEPSDAAAPTTPRPE